MSEETSAPIRAAVARRLSLLLGLALAAPAGAQPLVGARSVSVAPTVETWSFADGLPQPTLGGTEARLRRVTQLAVPVTVRLPLGRRLAADVSGGWASGTVTLAAPDEAGRTSWSLAGPTDTRLRLTGRLAGETVLLTLGTTLPTGRTELDGAAYDAARVLAAPALGLASPVLGEGAGVTAGVVAARAVGRVSLALGASYEARTSFSPIGLAAGLPALDYDPSDAVRVSLMADALVGRGQMTAGLSVDAFGPGTVAVAAEGAETATNALRLGPVLTGEWHWQLPATRFQSLVLSVVDRVRLPYERDGATVAGSAANYLDVSLTGLLPLSTRTDLLLGAAARHHTGLDADDTIAAAAFAGGTLTLGLARDLGRGYALQPHLRVQAGRIETAGRSSRTHALASGIVVTRSF